MAHPPFGYKIVNRKIEIHAREAEQLKLLIQSYLSGQSLANAQSILVLIDYMVELQEY